MNKYIPREVKNSFGMRCTEDSTGTLRIGKGRSATPMTSVINPDIINKIKKAIENIRGTKGGRFWFNGISEIVIITGSMEKGWRYYRVDINTGKSTEIDPFEYG